MRNRSARARSARDTWFLVVPATRHRVGPRQVFSGIRKTAEKDGQASLALPTTHTYSLLLAL